MQPRGAATPVAIANGVRLARAEAVRRNQPTRTLVALDDQGHLTRGAARRTAAVHAVDGPHDWARKVGWYVDLSLSSGERVTVDMQQQLGILTVATNVPETSACSAGGSSWLYFLDVGSGSFVSTSADEAVGYFLGNTLVEGITTFEKSGGGTGTLVVDNRGGIRNEDNPPPPPLLGGARRTSWRELMH